MMAVVLSNQIAGFVAVPSEKKNIYVIRRPGGSYWEKLCPGRTQEQGHSSDAWEKNIFIPIHEVLQTFKAAPPRALR